jgi:formylglycine-generating enzyme
MGGGRLGKASAVLILGVVATWAWACSTITGADAYAEVTGCTGPSCSLKCAAQGGTWDASAATCTCSGGTPLCNGACCGSTEPYCVTTSTGVERCSTCEAAAYECGPTCCDDQECLNASIGACGAAYGVPGQSCAGGLTCPVPLTDGTTQKADCCQSIALPGGTFEMGRSIYGKNRCPETACSLDEEPPHSVTLSPYALDRFEVTVSRFRKFVDAWDYEAPPAGAGGDAVVADAGWQSAWNTSLPASRSRLERDLECLNDQSDIPASTLTSAPGYDENLPINCVTWYEAFVFCVWDGGRLPTEAEWEYAAANGANADLYPWGEAVPTQELAVYDCGLDPAPCGVSPPFPAYVGSRPGGANRWGHDDLAGNVNEWVLDAIAPYPSEPVTNPASTFFGFRIARGGAYIEYAYNLRAAFRGGLAPNDTASSFGFRCARAP